MYCQTGLKLMILPQLLEYQDDIDVYHHAWHTLPILLLIAPGLFIVVLLGFIF